MVDLPIDAREEGPEWEEDAMNIAEKAWSKLQWWWSNLYGKWKQIKEEDSKSSAMIQYQRNGN